MNIADIALKAEYFKSLVRFVEPTHQYFIGEREVRGVSRVLKQIGENKSMFVPPRKYAIKGTRLHKQLEEYELFETPIVRVLYAFMEKYNASILCTETVLYDEECDYAGTTDAIMEIDGRITTVDYKTGQKEPWHHGQLALYAKPFGITHGLDLYITEGGYKPQFFTPLQMASKTEQLRKMLLGGPK